MILPVVLTLPQLLQQLAHPSCRAQLSSNVGCQAQIPLSIQPAGLDIRGQLTHRFSECREDLLDLARSEPPFSDHASRPLGCSVQADAQESTI